MSQYAICFDFPSKEEPVFAFRQHSRVATKDGWTYTEQLDEATRFATHDEAAQALAGYGTLTSRHGDVVEVGA